MIKVMSLDIPNVIPIIISTPFKAAKWRKRINKNGFTDLLLTLQNNKNGTTPTQRQMQKLITIHKVASAYLRRIKRDPNPCIVTSLILFESCQKQGFKANLIIGADKENNSIKGHSWVEIKNLAINESDELLKKYTRMTEI